MTLLEWAPDAPFPPVHGKKKEAKSNVGADKYHGEVATGYDAKREQSPKWVVEQRTIEAMLSDLGRGTRVLDCPIGTGRFIPFYAERGFNVVGADKSPDMLEQALLKVEKGQSIQFGTGDVTRLDKIPDKTFDVSLMCRLTRWLVETDGVRTPENVVLALKELQRVTKDRIIFTARVRDHQWAVPYDLIESALDGWKIHRDEQGYEEPYRIIELRPG